MLVSESDPLTLPVVVGAKTTLNEVFLPAPIVVGTVKPLVLNPLPDTVSCEIVTLAFPPFVKVIVAELLWPVTTSPRAAEDGFAERPA